MIYRYNLKCLCNMKCVVAVAEKGMVRLNYTILASPFLTANWLKMWMEHLSVRPYVRQHFNIFHNIKQTTCIGVIPFKINTPSTIHDLSNEVMFGDLDLWPWMPDNPAILPFQFQFYVLSCFGYSLDLHMVIKDLY